MCGGRGRSAALSILTSAAVLGDFAGFLHQWAGGAGGFGGVLSLPWYWVWIDGLVSALIGVVLGVVSARIAAAVTPKASPAEG